MNSWLIHLEVARLLAHDLADLALNEEDDETQRQDLGRQHREHEGADVAVEAHHVEAEEAVSGCNVTSA